MIATVMLGWLVVGMVAGAVAGETIFRDVAVERSQLALLGAVGAWAGGLVAILCRLGLRPDDPGHWTLALLGSAVLLAFRFLELKPRTIS
jgi:uncharacterized membrane protein YeaQ/YmgE (transglycosylase-associated protein family)